jgi:succinate dehydrogenase/fumarate reductase flavoprotein subunit
LDTAGEALEYLEQRSSVRFASAGKHPDYLPEAGSAIGGRAVATPPFNGRLLGDDFVRIRPPIPEFMLLGGMMVGKADIQALVGRYASWRDFLHSARLVMRYAADRLRYPRGTRLVMGNALVARLFHSLRAANVEIRFGWRLRDLVLREGRMVGAAFEERGGTIRRVAARSVVLASGGVGHEAGLRRELVPQGDHIYSLAADSVRGDGLIAARRAGAAIERHARGNLFWQPVSIVPGAPSGGGLFPHLFMDRAKPGLIAVDALGRRFVDESLSYHHFVQGLLQKGRAWLVCDAAFVHRYGLGAIPPGTRLPGRWVRNGYIACEPTINGLAQRVGIDATALAETIARMNGFAVTGTDLEFGKGATEVGRFNGDPAHAPNPCLGPIATPPFCALAIHGADAASSAGLATDRDGKVLGLDAAPIPGLYACGNDAASVMQGTYPGPGATLGPAIVFGYRVGRNVALHPPTDPLNA